MGCIYRFPKDRAAEIAVNTVKEFLSTNNAAIEVTFVCFDDENYRIYKEVIQ